MCDLLNIQYPILQGAMAWIAGEAGGSRIKSRRPGVMAPVMQMLTG